ncbi:MAG: RHS repeat-associated core domain-containing protein [Opitutaceae bacterium]|nr:RHS repeat-associated core domain-containing protein [Opitutaceae bacterium]
MKFNLLPAVALLMASLLPLQVHAQGDDRKAAIKVEITGTAIGINYDLITDAEDANPTYILHETGSSGSLPVSQIVRQKPGVVYAVQVQQSSGSSNQTDYGNFALTIKAPPGYTVFVDTDNNQLPDTPLGVAQISNDKLFTDGNPWGVYYQLVESGALSAALPGKMTRLDVGDLVFELGLGSLKNGKSAGRLQVRSDGRIGGSYGLPSGVFAISAVTYVGPSSTGLTWQNITSGQKLETGQVKVEKINAGTNIYTISFYAGDNAGGYNSSAYATYTLEKITSGLPTNAPSSSDCLKITEVQGSLTIVRYVFRSTAGDTWTLIEGTSSEQRIEEHAGASVSGNREETITVKNSSLAAVAKSRLTWAPYSPSELLTKTEIWTDAASGSPGLTTDYEYYTGGGIGAGDLGKLKKVTYPNGGTTEYDYYDDTARLGQIYTVTEPWSTGSSNLTKITTYDYAGPTGALKDYVSSEETTIGGTTVAKTTHSYDFSTTSADSLALVVRTSTHYAASGSTLTSITSTYNKGVDYFFANKPYMFQTPDGGQKSFRYEKGTWSGSSFTAGSGDASRTWIVDGSHLGGSATTSISGLTFASIGLVTKQSTLTEVIRDAEDNVLSEKSYVWDGSSFDTTTPIVNTSSTWLDGVRQTGRTEVNGAQSDWTWNGAYLASEKNAAGVELTYGYDSVGRMKTVTRTSLGAYDSFQAFDALLTTFVYDAANRKSSQIEAGGSLTRTTTFSYDAAGRSTGVALPDGRSGSTVYTFPGSNITQIADTLPGGATRTTQTLIDGKVKQVTGTAGVETYYSYSKDSYGQITAQINYASGSSARWQKTITDWLGRAVENSRPGYTGQSDMTETTTYDGSTGLPTKVARTGLADEYRSYDVMGHLTRSGIDLGANSSLATSDTADRVTDYETIFDKVSSDWWVRSTATIYPSTSSPTTAFVTGKNWTRLTGLGSGTLANGGVEDHFGNRVNTVTTVDRTKRRVTSTTTYPEVSNTAVSVSNNGMSAKMTGTDTRSVTQSYDSLGRLYQQADSRTGTTAYVYITNGSYATDQLSTVTDPTSAVVATYTYDSAGRIASVKNAGNHYAYYNYDYANRPTQQWGGAVTPVEYVYNSYGEMTDQKTFRSGTWTGSTWPGGTADTTTFTYDGPSGLLTRKQDNSSNHVDYTYNNRGLVYTREWARLNGSSQQVKTTYAYATNSVELTGKTYNDGTTDVSFTYNRLGQMLTAVDVSNGTTTETRTFEYDSDQRLATEKLPSYLGSRWITYTYETSGTGTVAGRASGYTLGVSGTLAQDLTSLLGYSGATGNIASLTATHYGVSARTFNYTYTSGSSLVAGVSQSGISYSQTRNYESTRDLLEEFTTKFSTTTKTRYDYTYNNLGQKESAKQTGQGGSAFDDLGDTFYRYAYNGRGELTEAKGYLGSSVSTLTTQLSGRIFEFGYDQAGNRASANSSGVSGLQSDYTANALNQISARENNYVAVSGTVDAAAKVVVNGSLAGQQTNHWAAEVVLPNTSGPVYANASDSTGIQVKAAKPTPETAKISGLLSAFIPAASESFTYDLDGNLTDDGQWDYTWDAENRLVKMETDSVAMAVGLPGTRLVFRYDSLGRRTVKEKYSWSGSSWGSPTELRFVYQGWNLIAELDNSGNRQRTYAWGLDLSGSLSGMGGIGALIQVVDHTGTVASYLPGYDGSGNVAALMKSDGTISAAYEYGAFGESLRRDGAFAAANPFRSATKYTDDESGLVYYGTRYYSPSLGRFINRDSIGEAGGINLYAFAGNDGVNGGDYLGMDTFLEFGGYNENGGLIWRDGGDYIIPRSKNDLVDFTFNTYAEGSKTVVEFSVTWQIHRDYVMPWAREHGWRKGDPVKPFNSQNEALAAAKTVALNSSSNSGDSVTMPSWLKAIIALFRRAPNRAGTDTAVPGSATSATGGGMEIGKSYSAGGGTVVVQTYKTFTGNKSLPAGNGGALLVINYNAANEKNYQWMQVVTKDTLPNKDPNKTVPYVDQVSGAQGNYYYNQGSVDYIYKPGQAIFQDRPYGTGPGELNFNLRLVDTTRNDATVYQFQWGFVYNKDGTVTAVPITGSAPGGKTP